PPRVRRRGTRDVSQLPRRLLVLEQVRVIERRRPAGPEDLHDDREPHDHLGCGDDHHEEGDDLSLDVSVHPGERYERQVAGVEHELHAHEDDDRVAAHEDADRADGEQQRRKDDVVHRVHEDSTSCPSPFSSCSSAVPPPTGWTPCSRLSGPPVSSSMGSATLTLTGSEALPASAVRPARASSGTCDWCSGARAVRTGLSESWETLPSGSSAGMSIALC